MKREPRITLPIKKSARVDKLEPQWRLWIWYFLMTLLVLWVWQELGNQVEYRTISYSEFKTYLAQGAIAEAVVKQDEIDGRIVPKPDHETKNKPAENAKATPSPGATQPASAEAKPFFFRTERIEDPGLVNELQSAGVRFEATRVARVISGPRGQVIVTPDPDRFDAAVIATPARVTSALLGLEGTADLARLQTASVALVTMSFGGYEERVVPLGEQAAYWTARYLRERKTAANAQAGRTLLTLPRGHGPRTPAPAAPRPRGLPRQALVAHR